MRRKPQKTSEKTPQKLTPFLAMNFAIIFGAIPSEFFFYFILVLCFIALVVSHVKTSEKKLEDFYKKANPVDLEKMRKNLQTKYKHKKEIEFGKASPDEIRKVFVKRKR